MKDEGEEGETHEERQSEGKKNKEKKKRKKRNGEIGKENRYKEKVREDLENMILLKIFICHTIL